MAGAELRPALEQRLAALAIRTEVVEHPEVFTVEEMMPHIQHLKGAHSYEERKGTPKTFEMLGLIVKNQQCSFCVIRIEACRSETVVE